MRKLLETISSLLIAALALGALWRWVIIPYQCNVTLKRTTNALEVALSIAPDSMRATEIVRRSVADLQKCEAACPDDIAVQMALAAGYRALGQNAKAISAYETALKYDRRPELYLNLGQTQLAVGDSRNALPNLALACIYNPGYLDEIGQYHTEVKNAVDLYQLQMLNAKH